MNDRHFHGDSQGKIAVHHWRVSRGTGNETALPAGRAGRGERGLPPSTKIHSEPETLCRVAPPASKI
jgi:hypothetical protein